MNSFLVAIFVLQAAVLVLSDPVRVYTDDDPLPIECQQMYEMGQIKMILSEEGECGDTCQACVTDDDCCEGLGCTAESDYAVCLMDGDVCQLEGDDCQEHAECCAELACSEEGACVQQEPEKSLAENPNDCLMNVGDICDEEDACCNELVCGDDGLCREGEDCVKAGQPCDEADSCCEGASCVEGACVE